MCLWLSVVCVFFILLVGTSTDPGICFPDTEAGLKSSSNVSVKRNHLKSWAEMRRSSEVDVEVFLPIVLFLQTLIYTNAGPFFCSIFKKGRRKVRIAQETNCKIVKK